jgi:transcriptional regulator with XRE-family HTH domain
MSGRKLDRGIFLWAAEAAPEGFIMNRGKLYIREWRKFKKLTQAELAEKIGVDPTQISRIESGKRNYDRPTLEAIASVLGCPVGFLLTVGPEEQDELQAVWSELSDRERRQLLRHAHVILQERQSS